jgi:hypothetical protein
VQEGASVFDGSAGPVRAVNLSQNSAYTQGQFLQLGQRAMTGFDVKAANCAIHGKHFCLVCHL